MAQIWWSDCKLLERMHKSIAALLRGFSPLDTFWQTGLICDQRLLTSNPHLKSSIGIYAMIYWIGLNGWQCNICAAHDYTHSLLLQLDLSLLSVSDTRYIVYAPLVQPLLYQNCDLAPCTITQLSLVYTNKKKKACIRILWYNKRTQLQLEQLQGQWLHLLVR